MKYTEATTSVAYLNCMQIRKTAKLFKILLEKIFNIEDTHPQEMLLKKFQEGTSKTKIIVLDEVDHFFKNEQFTYNILEWINIHQSKIILILISNVIDFATKLNAKNLSRLKNTSSIIFSPNTAHEISQIILHTCPEIENYVQPGESKKFVNLMAIRVIQRNSDIREVKKLLNRIIKEYNIRGKLTCT